LTLNEPPIIAASTIPKAIETLMAPLVDGNEEEK
jgi:hypothetical protein